MKKTNLQIYLTFFIGFSFCMSAMENLSQKKPDVFFARGPEVVNVKGGVAVTLDKGVTINRKYAQTTNVYRRTDFKNGDSNASWFRQVWNAAIAVIPALIYEAPPHIVSSLSIQVLSKLILEWINSDKLSDLDKLKKLVICKQYFASKMSEMSKSDQKYEEYKRKLDETLKKEEELEKKIYDKLYHEVIN